MPVNLKLVNGGVVAFVVVLAALAAAPAIAYKAKIRETSYGIPHVKAKNYGSAGYGVGYAFAKQNICTFADNNVTTSARRSKFFGPDGETPASAAGPVNNLDSDFFWQSVIDSGRIEKLLKAKGVQSPSKDAKAAIRGYAAGYNAYLKKVGVDGIPDPRCSGEKWVKPIKPIDVWRRIYQADLLASSQNFISDFVAAQPPTSTSIVRRIRHGWARTRSASAPRIPAAATASSSQTRISRGRGSTASGSSTSRSRAS
jgi:acyl-homoserine-lactone acylase